MAVVTANRAMATFPVGGHGFAGNKKVAWGQVDLGATPIAGVYNMCRLPKGALVTGGNVNSNVIQTTTASVQTMTMAVGTTLSSEGAFFATAGVSASSIPTLVAAGAVRVPLGGVLLANAPYEVTGEDIVTVTLSTAAGYTTTLSGKVWVEVEYLLP